MTCACGCRRETTVFKGVSRRFINGHHSRKSGALFTIEPAGYKTPCWLWQLGKDRGGYGVVKVKRRSVIAHKRVFEMCNGPVNSYLELDHLCRNRGCVRPDHMEPVPAKVNCRRGSGTKFPQTVIDCLFEMKRSGERNTYIALTLGISKQHVGNILKGVRRAD